MGDAGRMQADLAVAHRLAAAHPVPGFQAQVAATLKLVSSVHVPSDPPAALMTALRHDVATGAPWTRVVDDALDLRRVVDAHRKRYDEYYQDRLRTLEAALSEKPDDPDRMTALARFLLQEAEVLSEQVDPRDDRRYYRYQPPGGEGREVATAKSLVNKALAAHPDNVQALGVLAGIQIAADQYDQAAATLRRGLALAPDDLNLLELMARVLAASAQRKASTAADLKRIRIWWENRWDLYPPGDYMFTRYPSQAELEQAKALEDQASALNALAQEKIEKAAKASAGTAHGFYFLGCRQRAQGDLQAARASMTQAVRLQPDDQVAWFQLAGIDTQLGLGDEAVAARATAVNLTETTAAPWLVAARYKIMHDQLEGARNALASAQELDPDDSRIQAWLGVVDTAESKPNDAVVDFATALAMEEARARLHGRTLSGSSPLPLDGDDIGLTLTLRLRIAAILMAEGRSESAQAFFKADVTFLSGVPARELSEVVPSSILPTTTAEPGQVPLADTWGVLLARSQGGLDYAAWTQRYHDPQDLATASATYRRLLVDYVLTDTGPEAVAAVVGLGLAELEASKGNFQQADQWLANRGATPQPLWQEMRKVEAQIRARSTGGSSGQPLDTRAAATLRLLKSQEQQLRQRLTQPGLTSARQADIQKQIDELEREMRELGGG